jgi:hypothetical protein
MREHIYLLADYSIMIIMKIFRLSAILCILLLVFSSVAFAKFGTQDPQDPGPDLTPPEQLQSQEDIQPKTEDSGPETPDTGPETQDTSAGGSRALISGVPGYYQLDMTIPGACEGDAFPTGCGPVAGASILGWWERRGVSGLMSMPADSNGLPQDLIIELGRGKYMDRITGCGQTAVLPDRFKSGLNAYLNDYSPIDFTITKYKITENTGITYLWSIVKSEIDAGRPMIYLYRSDGDKDNNGYSYASHYAVVVGYDENKGRKALILQTNWGSGDSSGSYMNTYKSDDSYQDNRFIELGHFARPKAAINFNLYTIKPETTPDYSGECSGWLLNGQEFHDYDPLDGVQSDFFKPEDRNLRENETWSQTSSITKQDDICFVAHWYDSDGDGIYDGFDNCVDVKNFDQEDSDSDGVGDVCDYPDLVLNMEYGDPVYSWQNISGRIKLTFDLFSNLTNEGTEPIEAGSKITVHWSQETLEMGGDSVPSSQSSVPSNSTAGILKVSSIVSKNGTIKLNYNILSKDNASKITAIPMNEFYNPLAEESQSITLSTDFEPGDIFQLNDQRYNVYLDSFDDCVLVTHSANAQDDIAKELDEDNTITLVGYDSLMKCYGVMEVDIESMLEDKVGKQIGVKDFREWEKDVTEAGMDQVINIIKEIGPDGGRLVAGPVILDFPQDAFANKANVEVKEIVKTLSIMRTVGSVYEIKAGGMMSKPATITMSYNENELGGISEQNLAIFTSNGARWQMLPSTVDAAANTVTANVKRFSLFTIGQRNKSAAGQKTFDPKPFLKKGERLKGWKNTTWNGKPAFAIQKIKKRKLLGLFEVEMEYTETINPRTLDTEQRELPWWNALTTD